MSRDLTTAVQSIVDSKEVQPFLLMEGEFISGTVRVWSGYGDLSWNSQTWVGTGTLLQVSSVEETSDGSANGVTVTMSGIPSTMISLALSDVKQSGLGKVWLGFLDDGVVSDPVLLFEGYLDVPSINDNAETSTLVIAYESRLIDLKRPRETRYTNEEQQAMYPGDLGCEYVAGLQDISIEWGKSSS